MSRDRYAQCDETCTVDCGACKGAGRPTADLTPAQAARIEAIEAAPYAEEAAVERVARALYDANNALPNITWDLWGENIRDHYRRLAVAAIDVMRGAADDGAIGRVQLCPKCNGQGTVSKPPWIPGDVHTWSSGTLAPHRCNLCDGRMVIGAPATAEGDAE